MMFSINYIRIMFITVLLHKVIGQRTPTISYISQEQIADIGSSVSLDCSILYAQDYPVVWFKTTDSGRDFVLAVNTALSVRDSRFSLRHDDTSSTYTLQIKDLKETDAGLYTCRIQLTVMTDIQASVELQVRRPPFISDNSTRSVIVSEGESVTFRCYAGGFPAPKISWRRQNNAILPTGGLIHRGNILKIPSVEKEARGTYYCIADNGVGQNAKRHIYLDVEFAPIITATRSRLGQALQFDMDLNCYVEASPIPSISWYKNNVQLSNSQHYQISISTSTDELTESTIRILTIDKNQFGEYVCKADNKFGAAETTIELFETMVPMCPPACGESQYISSANVNSFESVILILLLSLLLMSKY